MKRAIINGDNLIVFKTLKAYEEYLINTYDDGGYENRDHEGYIIDLSDEQKIEIVEDIPYEFDWEIVEENHISDNTSNGEINWAIFNKVCGGSIDLFTDRDMFFMCTVDACKEYDLDRDDFDEVLHYFESRKLLDTELKDNLLFFYILIKQIEFGGGIIQVFDNSHIEVR